LIWDSVKARETSQTAALVPRIRKMLGMTFLVGAGNCSLAVLDLQGWGWNKTKAGINLLTAQQASSNIKKKVVYLYPVIRADDDAILNLWPFLALPVPGPLGK